jgi:predicted transposase YbfD/YdcC
MALRPATLAEIIRDWCGDLSGQHVAIDGKVLRGACDGTTGRSMVHVLRAWVGAQSLSAGHVSCEQKSNELEALPRLLDALVLQGAIVSIDAMGTHSAIATQIHDSGADYVLALKANQKQALEAVASHFNAADEISSEPPLHHQSHETVALSHGRFERREYQATAELGWWPKSWKWEGLQSVVRVRRWSHRGGQQSGELALETHYYLSSLPADAARLAQIIRGHWSVENSCHHVLDVTFQEDHCQVRDTNAAHNLSILREMALRALKTHPSKGSMRAKRKRAALDPFYRTQLIADITHPF